MHGLARGSGWTAWASWWGPRPARAWDESWQDFQSTVAWLLGLQLLDLLTTLAALGNGATEANPLAAALMASAGPAALVHLKIVALVLMLGWVPAYHCLERRDGPRSLAAWATLGLVVALALLYTGVVLNNLTVFQATLGP